MDSVKQTQHRYFGVTFVFDILIFALLGISLGGGFPFHGHLYFHHAADSRRAAIILAVLGYFLWPRLKEKSFVLRGIIKFGQLLSYPILCWGFYALVTGFSCVLAVEQALALRVPLYDVGIFHQILWSLTHGLQFSSTISGAGDFLKDHFAPSLWILAPLFSLFHGSPLFLPIMHSILIFGGAAAWIFLAMYFPRLPKEFRHKLGGAVCVFTLGFDSLWGNLRWGFHENALGFFCLSWAFALFFSEEANTRPFFSWLKKGLILILLLIAAGAKEILLLDVGLILGVWAVFEALSSWKERKASSLVFSLVFGLISFGLFLKFIEFEQMGHPSDKNYFIRYYSYLGNNLKEFILALYYHPALVFENIGQKDLIKYLITVFLPWVFLPFLAGVTWFFREKDQIHLKFPLIWLLTIIPSFASAALATYPPLRNPYFHYVLELWPILASLTVIVLAQLRSSTLMWVWAVLSLLFMDHDPIGDFREYWKEAEQLSGVRNKLQEIPVDSSVAADELSGTWLAGRRWVMRWPDTSLLPNQCPDYIIVTHAERGTITELGVSAVISRCRSGKVDPVMNSDLIVPTPLWREGIWSEYQVRQTAHYLER